MNIDPNTGVLSGARQLSSPNCDERPDDYDISLIVVHGISLPPGEYGGPCIDQFFTNSLVATAHPYFAEIADLQVSSHLLIRRDGETVQYVPFHKRAWHAGASCYRGRVACNDFSIGIEMEGQDDELYTEQQYDVLVTVISVLIATYPALSIDRLKGHCDISPQRKTDPGPAFDWPHLRRKLAALSP